MSTYRFPFDRAETTLLGLLDRRAAIRSTPAFSLEDPELPSRYGLDAEWIAWSRKAYEVWRTRTPLALPLCGLLARATDAEVDPLSLQDGSGPFGFSATSLWRDVIHKHAGKRMSLRKLKDQPFNNSPFNGKRRLSMDWENVSEANSVPIADAFEMLTQVEAMSVEEAEKALLSFIVAAPDPVSALTSNALESEGANIAVSMSLVEFADAVLNFIRVNSDDGRRAQAFVAACTEVVLPGRIMTPSSIHDPSRSAPGDVKSHDLDNPKAVGPLLIEVKDKLIHRSTVEAFIVEVRRFDSVSSAGYAALANNVEAEESLAQRFQIPGSDELTRGGDLPSVVWKSPLELLTQAALWSALPSHIVVWRCAHNYRKWLDHLDTGKNNSPGEWDALLTSWGMLGDEAVGE